MALDDELTPAQRSLVEDNIGIGKFCVGLAKNRHLVAKIGYSDAMQEAMVALCVAAKTFDSSRGTKFTTWAQVNIRSRLTNVATYRSSLMRCRDFKIYGVPAGAKLKPLNFTIRDHRGNSTDAVSDRLDLAEVLRFATAAERRDIALFLQGKTMAEIGQARGTTKQAASLRINKFLRRARGKFNQEAAT